MKTAVKYLPIILVFILSLTLRVWNLSNYPTGLNADEAAIGYNAYSLLLTGKDEFSHPWPINFQSFNDFKPGLYFYLVMPFVGLLGLNELTVRLPSAILGSLTVVVIYLLVKELFGKEKNSETFAVISALLLAISPWHIHFSRGGWETNIATFFITLGVYLFFYSFKKPFFLSLSALSMVLAMLSYHSARVVAPLLVLGLILGYFKKIFFKSNRKNLLLTVIIAGFPFLLLLFSLTGGAGGSRFSGVGIFADQGPFWRANELRGQHLNPLNLFPKIVHNRYLEYGIQFLDNYLRHFSGSYLFISGDEIQRNKVPDMGQFFIVLIPFLFIGLCSFIRKKPGEWKIIFWWLLIAPVASALTFQSPHAIRSLNVVIPLTVIIAYGVFNAYIWAKEKSKLTVILLSCCFAISVLWNFGFYLHEYYVHYAKTYPSAWEDGFRELVSYVKQNQDRFDKIYITNKYDQPYILFAFYLKYPPQIFQKEAVLTQRDKFGFSTVGRFGKYNFGPINWQELQNQPRVMIVASPEETINSAKIVERIYFKDGKTEAFRIIEN